MKWLAKFGKWLARTFNDSEAQHANWSDFDADRIESANWRQGCLLPGTMVESLVSYGELPQIDERGCWVLLTQDCDLVHHDLASEPMAEVVFGKEVDKPNKGYTWSKNARELHLHDELLERSLAFQTRYRRTISRYQLCEFTTVDRLAVANIALLTRWVSRKYFRAAFPDAFNKRVRSQEKKIRKLLERSPGEFQEIHINVSTEELPDDQTYNVIVLCIAAEDTAEDDQDYMATETLGDEFGKLLSLCPGINVVACEVRYRSEVTLDELDPMQRWDFDSITIRKSDTVDEAPTDY